MIGKITFVYKGDNNLYLIKKKKKALMSMTEGKGRCKGRACDVAGATGAQTIEADSRRPAMCGARDQREGGSGSSGVGSSGRG